MRSDVRSAEAVTVSTASSFAARMAARIAAGSQRSRPRVLWMNCSGRGVSIAVLRGTRELGELQRASVLRDASSDFTVKRLKLGANSPGERPRATEYAYRIDLHA